MQSCVIGSAAAFVRQFALIYTSFRTTGPSFSIPGALRSTSHLLNYRTTSIVFLRDAKSFNRVPSRLQAFLVAPVALSLPVSSYLLRIHVGSHPKVRRLARCVDGNQTHASLSSVSCRRLRPRPIAKESIHSCLIYLEAQKTQNVNCHWNCECSCSSRLPCWRFW